MEFTIQENTQYILYSHRMNVQKSKAILPVHNALGYNLFFEDHGK